MFLLLNILGRIGGDERSGVYDDLAVLEDDLALHPGLDLPGGGDLFLLAGLPFFCKPEGTSCQADSGRRAFCVFCVGRIVVVVEQVSCEMSETMWPRRCLSALARSWRRKHTVKETKLGRTRSRSRNAQLCKAVVLFKRGRNARNLRASANTTRLKKLGL